MKEVNVNSRKLVTSLIPSEWAALHMKMDKPRPFRYETLWCKVWRKRDLRYFKHQRKRYKGVIRVVTNRVKERIKLGRQ